MSSFYVLAWKMFQFADFSLNPGWNVSTYFYSKTYEVSGYLWRELAIFSCLVGGVPERACFNFAEELCIEHSECFSAMSLCCNSYMHFMTEVVVVISFSYVGMCCSSFSRQSWWSLRRYAKSSFFHVFPFWLWQKRNLRVKNVTCSS